MTPAEHAALDEATVAMLLRTGGFGVRLAVAVEEVRGRPVYDQAPDLAPRDQIARCAVCRAPFVRDGHGTTQLYCGPRCRRRAAYLRERVPG